MTSLRSWLVSGAALIAATVLAPPAQAQEARFGAHVTFGAQTGSGDLAQQLKPTIYDELATIDITQTYESGPLIDLGGEYFFGGFGIGPGTFGVGVSYSHTSGDGNAVLAGQIPDPLFFDRPRGAAAQATGLNHSEDAVHISLLYRFAATPKIDVTVGLGPTFFSVKQDLISSVSVAEASGGPTMTPAAVEQSDGAAGVNVGADVTYMVTKRFGAGLLLRYAKSTAKLQPPDTDTPVKVRAGGFQVGAGLRVRF